MKQILLFNLIAAGVAFVIDALFGLLPALISLSCSLVIISLIILRKHRANVRRHRAHMGVIGSDPRLTDVLHQRLLSRHQYDWLNPTTMSARAASWLRHHGGEG